MNEDRPALQIPLPPPEWKEYIRKMEEQKKEEEEDIDGNDRVVILDL